MNKETAQDYKESMDSYPVNSTVVCQWDSDTGTYVIGIVRGYRIADDGEMCIKIETVETDELYPEVCYVNLDSLV